MAPLGNDQRLRRFGAAVLLFEVVVLSLIVGPLTNSVTDRWRRELAALMGPTPFAAPAEFALAEGRIAFALLLIAGAFIGVWALWSTELRPALLGVSCGALMTIFSLWALLVSTAW